MYAGLDHHVYTPAVIDGQSLTTPTKFCFAMKVKNFSLSSLPCSFICQYSELSIHYRTIAMC